MKSRSLFGLADGKAKVDQQKGIEMGIIPAEKRTFRCWHGTTKGRRL